VLELLPKTRPKRENPSQAVLRAEHGFAEQLLTLCLNFYQLQEDAVVIRVDMVFTVAARPNPWWDIGTGFVSHRNPLYSKYFASFALKKGHAFSTLRDSRPVLSGRLTMHGAGYLVCRLAAIAGHVPYVFVLVTACVTMQVGKSIVFLKVPEYG
jgi:hypothetical protein